MRALVVGLLPHESGKTTVVLHLARELRSRGMRVGYAKPVAGHDGWRQVDSLRASLELGVLVGHDAFVISRELGLLEKLLLVNPLDVLSLPPDPLSFRSARSYVDAVDDILHTAVLCRLAKLEGGAPRAKYFVIGENAARLSPKLGAIVRRLLEAFGEREPQLRSPAWLWDILNSPETYSAVDEALLELERQGFDAFVIEGYNDVSAPTPASANVGYAIVVAPGRALVYEGSRYSRAVEVLSGGRPWALRTGTALEVLGSPLASVELQSLLDEDEYREAIEKLADVVAGKS
ncbi:MAG: ATPase [Desulfurococcaceae archaeon]